MRWPRIKGEVKKEEHRRVCWLLAGAGTPRSRLQEDPGVPGLPSPNPSVRRPGSEDTPPVSPRQWVGAGGRGPCP